MRFNQLAKVLAFLLMVLAVASCGKGGADNQPDASGDTTKIKGIWALHSIQGNFMEISDRKGFIEFLPDHRTRIRTGPMLYEYGTWKMLPDIGRIRLGNPVDTLYVEYRYKLSGDSLLMTTDNNSGAVVTFSGTKTDKYPIDPKTEGEVFPY